MSTSRGQALVLVVPLIVVLVAARRLVPDIGSVDFLMIFAAGALFGATLLGLVQMVRRQGDPGR